MAKKPQIIGTPALQEFLKQTDELIEFIVLSRRQAEHIDHVRRVAAKALAGARATAGAAENWEKIQSEDIGPAVKSLNRFTTLLRRQIFAGAVDSFLNYIGNCLKMIHEVHPEMLRTDEKLSFAEISQFSRISDLTDYMIEKRVLDLTFKGIWQLNNEVRAKNGFELFKKDRDLKVVSRYVEKRNLLVHNSGIVNRRYLQRVPSYILKVGKRVWLNSPFHAVLHLRKLAKSMDKRLVAKFKIGRRRLVIIQTKLG